MKGFNRGKIFPLLEKNKKGRAYAFARLVKILLLAGVILSPMAAWSNQEGWPWIAMCTATSIKKGLPMNVYSGGVWESEDGAKFVKLHTHLAQGVVISKIVVESAGATWTSNGTAFINFDDVIQESQTNGKPYLSGADGKNLVFDFMASDGAPLTAHSITLNFEKNVHPMVAAIHLFDATGTEFHLNVPRVVDGTAEASSTLEPQMSYDVMNLFDSRYEYAWASNHLATGVTLTFNFKAKQKIEKIKIWNGYQRSGIHCYSNSRVKKFDIIADGQEAGTLSVADVMGPQILDLPKALEVQSLQLACLDAYAGKSYKDLVISELRFFDGKDWFMLDPMPRSSVISASNHRQFQSAGLEGVLNQSLLQVVVEADNSEDHWVLRFRPDGSFFMNSVQYSDDQPQNMQYVLGNYEVKSTAPGLIHLRFFGLLKKPPEEDYGEMDCNGCGHDCNGDSEEDEGISIFQDLISVQKVGDDFVVKHTKGTQKINFDTLRMHFEE